MADDWLSAIPDSAPASPVVAASAPQPQQASAPSAAVPAGIPMMRITPGAAATEAPPPAPSSWLDALPDAPGPATDKSQMTGIMREPALVGSNIVKGLTSVVGLPGDVVRGVTALGGAQAAGDLQGNPLPSPPTFSEPRQFQPLQAFTPQDLAAMPGKAPIAAPTGHNPIDTETLLGLTHAAGITDRPDLQPQGALENLLSAGAQGVGMVAPAALTGGVSSVPEALRLAGTGAAMGIGGELGSAAGRQVGGTPGALIGGVAGSLIPVGAAAAFGKVRNMASGIKPLVSGNAQELSVGRTLNKLVGDAPIEESPIGQLSLAQATNNPEIAARVDLAPSYNATANAALLKAQQEAVQKQIGQIGPTATQADASSAFTNALRQGRQVAGSEENRLWTVPELAEAKITATPVQQAVNSAVASMDPVLQNGMTPQLKALVNRLNGLQETTPNPAMFSNAAPNGLLYDLAPAVPKAKIPPATTVQDLNGIRSGLERIARSSSDGAERMMARELSGAFMQGMDQVPEIAGKAAVTRPMYEMTPPGVPNPTVQIAPAVTPDPAIAQAYQSARDYTRQMRTMFGAPDAAGLLNKNAAGVYTKDASEGARQFFNFSNGSPEGPQSIAQLSDFIGQLKSQPMAPQVSGDMRDAARSYVASALTKAARVEEGQLFNPKTMQDFLRTNGPWIEKSGLFDRSQIDAANQLLEYSNMLRRQDQLLRQVNSSTQARTARQDTFVDQIINPTIRHIAEVGATIGGAHQHGIIGGVIGMAMGGSLEGLASKAENAMRQLMAEALLDPSVAKGLMMKASAANRLMMSPQARQAIDRARATATAAITSEAAFPPSAGAREPAQATAQ